MYGDILIAELAAPLKACLTQRPFCPRESDSLAPSLTGVTTHLYYGTKRVPPSLLCGVILVTSFEQRREGNIILYTAITILHSQTILNHETDAKPLLLFEHMIEGICFKLCCSRISKPVSQLARRVNPFNLRVNKG
jgi:hypothetical protein